MKQGNTLKAAIHNLGCKVNSYEAEIMQQQLIENGYEIVPFEEKADVYIVNTCSVTNIADRKSRQMLHKAKKENPEAVIVAAGCYVQTRESDEIMADGVDILLGNNKKGELIQLLENYFKDSVKTSNVENLAHEHTYEETQLYKTAEHTRAYIKVQDGCNQFCTYCIIPYARGRVRSRELPQIIEEVRNLADKGYKELVLTGIHLSSYGLDFAPAEAADKNDFVKYSKLIELIEEVAKVEGIERIRLGSLEPRIVTEEFVKRLAAVKKVCPHFHLSLQSGCDETLKRMNRHYSSEEYYEGVMLLRRYFKEVNGCEPAITTDVIAGFPGETEAEFKQSYDFVARVEFYETHIFKYSKRRGTKAAAMKEQLTEAVKGERSKRLIELNDENKKKYIQSLKDNADYVADILIEEPEIHNGVAYQAGYTREYVRCLIKTEEDYAGKIIRGKITEISPEGDAIVEGSI